MASFAEQYIVGTAGRMNVHDFQTFLRLYERSQELRTGKAQLLAGTQKNDLGIERGELFKIGQAERFEARLCPARDQMIRQYDQVVAVAFAIDTDIVLAIAGKGVLASSLGALQLHKIAGNGMIK